jgi:hypothetical protein
MDVAGWRDTSVLETDVQPEVPGPISDAVLRLLQRPGVILAMMLGQMRIV